MSTQSWTKGFALVMSSVVVMGCTPGADEAPVSLNELEPAVADYRPPVVSPESHDLTQEDIERLIEEGYIYPPARPGLGVRLDPERLAKYRI